MKLTYIYHSGFLLETDNLTIVLDYFKGLTTKEVEALLSRSGAFYILSSHHHQDHFTKDILEWREKRPDIQYVFSKDILKRKFARAEDATFLLKGDVFEDEQVRIEAFGSTDLGISFYIECAGKQIFHAGDLNNWHWKEESTEAEVKEAETNYLKELRLLEKSVSSLDVAMFPLDPRLGDDYARGARQFVDQIEVRLLVPMHFWEHPELIESFAPFAKSHGTRYEILTEKGENVDF